MLTFLGLLFILLCGVASIGVGIRALNEIERTDSLLLSLMFFLLAMFDIGFGIVVICALIIL